MCHCPSKRLSSLLPPATHRDTGKQTQQRHPIRHPIRSMCIRKRYPKHARMHARTHARLGTKHGRVTFAMSAQLFPLLAYFAAALLSSAQAWIAAPTTASDVPATNSR